MSVCHEIVRLPDEQEVLVRFVKQKPVDLWPLMTCRTCEYRQTFVSFLVKNGKAVGMCDRCKRQRRWTITAAI